VEAGNRTAARDSNPGRQAAIMLAVRMGRTVAIVVAVLVARFAFGIDDGIMAAAVALTAFTLRLLILLALRGDQPARGKMA
jgi:ABC-type Co2+ transport system permease subunit